MVNFSSSKPVKPQAFGTKSIALAASLIPTDFLIGQTILLLFTNNVSETVAWALLVVRFLMVGTIAGAAVVCGVKELRGHGTEGDIAPRRGRAIAGIIVAPVTFLLIIGVTAWVIFAR